MVIDYDNYLDFLKSQYDQKNRGYFFSYEYMARKLGFDARSHVYNLFQGVRKMTPVLAIRICKLMEMSDYETDYFITLLLLSEAETDVEINFLTKKKRQLYQLIVHENQCNSHAKIKQQEHIVIKKRNR